MNKYAEAMQKHYTKSSAFTNGPFVISKQRQDKQIKLLAQNTTLEHFFFVANIRDFEIKHTHGIKKWLGYSEKEFNMYQFYSILHPSQVHAISLAAMAMVELLSKGGVQIHFLNSLFVTIHAIKNSNGQYLTVKRVSTPFQYNKKNQLVEYINIFTIMGPYHGEPFNFRTSNISEEFDLEVRQYIQWRAHKEMPFSKRELDMLKLFASVDGINAQGIADKMAIQKNTVNTLKQRSISKARDWTGIGFSSAEAVAHFLSSSFLI